MVDPVGEGAASSRPATMASGVGSDPASDVVRGLTETARQLYRPLATGCAGSVARLSS